MDLKYGWWLPPNLGGEVASSVDSLIFALHCLMVVLFVGWGAFMVWVLTKYRARPGHTAAYELPKAKPSKAIEVAVVVAEVVLLVGFSMPVWAKVKNEIPTGPEVVRVRLVAEQFAWNFQYPGKDGKFGRRDAKLMSTENPLGLDPKDPDGKDDVVSLNLLHIPVKKDIVLEATSKDVIHSFYLPVLRAKHDLIPGMVAPIWFKATSTSDALRKALARDVEIADPTFLANKLGLIAMQDYKGADGAVIMPAGAPFIDANLDKLKAAGVKTVRAAPQHPAEIACAQLCGNSHYKMRGYLSIDTQQEFDAWLAASAGTGEEEEE